MESTCTTFWEPQLPDLLLAHRNVNLHFHTNIQQFIQHCPLIFIAIEMRTKKKGIGKKGRIEIGKWMETVRLIRDNADHSKSIIDKSDVPFDVRNTIIDVIQPTQVVHEFYTNPEFFSHGSAFDTLLNPRRVVFGNRAPHGDLTLLHHIYNFVPENNRLVINNARGVDFAKIYCNALLGCMGTLANIGSTFADDLKIDINQVFRIVDSEHRLGHGFLEPNVAVGGPALQRDIAYMAYMAEEGGHKEIAALFKGFIEVNKKRKEKFVKKMLKCMHSLKDKTIVILGFAYKAGTEDVSDSPSIYICEQLMRNEDVTLRVHDPIVSDEIITRCLKANGAGEQNLHVLPLRDQLFVDADAICIMTRAQEYLPINLPYQNIVQLMRNLAYFFDFTGNDAFNLLDLEHMGFHNIYSSGRPWQIF